MSEGDAASSLRTRSSLLFRLRNWSDEASWSEFYQLYYALVINFARRQGLQHADAEEVAQDVFKRIAETIHQFERDPNRGTFRGWLLQLTRWRIADKFRSAPPPAGSPRRPDDYDPRTATIDRVPDAQNEAAAQRAWDEEWQRHVLDSAWRQLTATLPAEHIQIFDLYHNQGWSAARVARELGVSLANVYVVKHRLTKQLKAEIERIRTQTL